MLDTTEETTILNEINNDPLSLGYSLYTSEPINGGAISNILNSPDPLSASVSVNVVNVYNLHMAVDESELSALSSLKLDQWNTFLLASQEGVIKNTGNVNQLIKSVFPNGTTSFTNIAALQSKDASRVEALIGREYTITRYEVYDILRG